MRSFLILAALAALSAATSAHAQTPVARTPKGAAMNPDISLNALMLYTNSSRGNDLKDAANADRTENGVSLQEAELQLFSAVDPYWNLSGIFSVHQEAEPDAAAGTIKREWKLEPEEVFAETTSVPYVTLRGGKFKAAMGRHNQLHTHAFPFIDAPLANTALLGDEGLNDVGVSAAALIPLPWYSEVIVQGLSGKTEGVDAYFGNNSPNAMVALARLRNLWDVGSESTLELGLSGARGKNSLDSETELVGADLTVKWRPTLFGSSRAIIWGSEAIQRRFTQTASTEMGLGLNTYVQAQFATRWWVQARADYLQQKDVVSGPDLVNQYARKYSALVGYVPSEFSAFRVQYDQRYDGRADVEHKIMAQLNFSIGAHPAHLY